MKRLFLLLFLATAWGQNITGVAPVTGSITSAASTCASLSMDSTNSGPSNCVSMPLPSSASTGAIVLTGTFSATVQFEVTADGGRTWISAPVASSTSAGTSTFAVNGYNGLRARASAYTSGTASVTINVGVGVGLSSPTTYSGTSGTLPAGNAFFSCTSTCTVTIPMPPVNGAVPNQYCIRNGNNVATVITLAALGSSGLYENTARTAYGTAGTGTLVSNGAAANMVCIVGLDATHYSTVNSSGTWTAN